MTIKYHISPKTGRKERCRADKKECKYKHFTTQTAEQAIQANDLNAYLDARTQTEHAPNKPDHTDFVTEQKIIYTDSYEQEIWDKIRENSETINYNDREFVITPENKSSQYCLTCTQHLTQEEADTLENSPEQQITASCGHKILRRLTGVSIQRNQTHLLHDEQVTQERWYHTSKYPNWDEHVNNPQDTTPFMHLGSLDAAIDRARHLNKGDNEGVYLYEIQLQPHTEIGDDILEDDPHGDDLPNIGDDYEDDENDGTIRENGVVRYLNHYEDTGSISLIADPRQLKILSKQAI